MTIKEFKQALQTVDHAQFVLPNNKKVPSHFHLTEIGKGSKQLIDCGGSLVNLESAVVQLWYTVDVNHRLKSEKMLKIVEMADAQFGLSDLEIEVEYQQDTMALYGLEFNGEVFQMTTKSTGCRAGDACGIPVEKVKQKLSDLTPAGCCDTTTGCC